MPRPERKFCGISQFILELGMTETVKLLGNKAVPVQKTNLWESITMHSSLILPGFYWKSFGLLHTNLIPVLSFVSVVPSVPILPLFTVGAVLTMQLCPRSRTSLESAEVSFNPCKSTQHTRAESRNPSNHRVQGREKANAAQIEQAGVQEQWKQHFMLPKWAPFTLGVSGSCTVWHLLARDAH